MSKVIEAIKTFVEPANKLIDAVSSAIGKVYEPTHVKRMANAHAHEINVIGKALSENADIPIVYDKGGISADIKDYDDFVKRTQGRMAYQELRKQQNIESVTEQAYQLLENETQCSNEPVSQDWMIRFFNSVEDISEIQMQSIWAKILAGEVKRPKSFSLRTLETLHNLSQEEAQLFQQVASFAIKVKDNPDKVFFSSNMDLLKKHGISYEDMRLLEECGLVSMKTFLQITGNISDETDWFYNNKHVILLKNKLNEEVEYSMGVIILTSAGVELFSILSFQCNEAYIIDVAENFFNENDGNILVKVKEISSIEGNEIQWQDENIIEFK